MLKILLILTVLFVNVSIKGQDPQFTQFYANPLYLSPSLTGNTEQNRVSISYRNQWPEIKNSFVTYSASYDRYFEKYNSGLGVLILRDQSGTGDLGLLNIGLLYSYDANVNDKIHFRPGIHFNYTQIGIDYYKLIWNDQLVGGGTSGSINEIPLPTKSDVDVSASLFLYTDKFWSGFTIDHLLNPNYGLYNNEVLWPIKYTLFGGYQFLNKSDYSNRIETLSLIFNYQHQDVYNQLIAGVYWNRNQIVLGSAYRGIPFRRENDLRGDALTFLLGFKTESYRIGYSYDFTISNLISNSGGSHEITFTYKFEKRKNRKKHKMIPCPDF